MSVNAMAFTTTNKLDRQSLGDLYDQHSPGIFRYAVRLLGTTELAEECVSETFSRFLGALRRGRGPGENIQAYLYRIAHNWITDYYRSNHKDPLPLDVEEPADHDGTPSQIVSRKLLQARVREALAELPFEHQYVIQLRFLENYSHEQASHVLGKSVEATRALQHRALKALRLMLIDAEE